VSGLNFSGSPAGTLGPAGGRAAGLLRSAHCTPPSSLPFCSAALGESILHHLRSLGCTLLLVSTPSSVACCVLCCLLHAALVLRGTRCARPGSPPLALLPWRAILPFVPVCFIIITLCPALLHLHSMDAAVVLRGVHCAQPGSLPLALLH
jgi:hypothetical protein